MPRFPRLVRRPGFLALLVASCALGTVCLPAQVPEKRYALVIGNSEYKDMGSLVNPINDAQDMGAALQGLGFELTLLLNGNRKQMNQALNDFHDRLAADPGSAGIFWYAGHGVQTNDGNFLVPVGADIRREADLEDEAVSVAKLMKLLDDARNKLNLVVLDACRNNPIVSSGRSGTRGLRPVSTAPAESIIIYSTGAGQVANDGSGRNSPFAQAFLKYLGQPGDITATIKAVTAETKRLSNGTQLPYVYSSLTIDFALAGNAAPARAALPDPAPALAAPAAGEPEFGAVSQARGNLSISLASAGTVSLLGKSVAVPAGGSLPVNGINPGDLLIEVRYPDGQGESRRVTVTGNATLGVAFSYKPAPVENYGDLVAVLNQMIGFTENLLVRLSLAGNARLVANALTLYAAALREPSARYHEQMRQHPGLLGQDGTPLKETPAELREVFGRLASVNQRLMQALVSLQVYGNDPDVRYALQKMADLAAE